MCFGNSILLMEIMQIFGLSLEAMGTVDFMILTYLSSQASNTVCLLFLETASSMVLLAVLMSNVNAANFVCLLIILLLINHINIFQSSHSIVRQVIFSTCFSTLPTSCLSESKRSHLCNLESIQCTLQSVELCYLLGSSVGAISVELSVLFYWLFTHFAYFVLHGIFLSVSIIFVCTFIPLKMIPVLNLRFSFSVHIFARSNSSLHNAPNFNVWSS